MNKEFLKRIYKKKKNIPYMSMWLFCCINCDVNGNVKISESELVLHSRSSRKMALNFIKSVITDITKFEARGKLKVYEFNVNDIIQLSKSHKTDPMSSESQELKALRLKVAEMQQTIDSLNSKLTPIAQEIKKEEDHPIISWIKRYNFKNISSIRLQLDNDQCKDLVKRFDSKTLSEIIREMDKDNDLAKTYSCLHTAIICWRDDQKSKEISDIVYRNIPSQLAISTIDKVDSYKLLEERKEEFKSKVILGFAEKYNKDMLVSFSEYWTEHNEKGKRMRFEKEKVFDISKRLVTWSKRENNNFNKNGITKAGFTNAATERQARTDSRSELNSFAARILTDRTHGKEDIREQE